MPMLTPALGVGVSAAFTTRLTAAALEVLALGDGLGDGVLLPVAAPVGEGSTVGPGADDAVDGGSPTVGVVPTSTTRGVGAPCTPTVPGLGELPDVDGDPEACGPGAVVVVTTGGGDCAAAAGRPGSDAMNAAIPKPPAATA
jgi:hypothetical protein